MACAGEAAGLALAPSSGSDLAVAAKVGSITSTNKNAATRATSGGQVDRGRRGPCIGFKARGGAEETSGDPQGEVHTNDPNPVPEYQSSTGMLDHSEFSMIVLLNREINL